MRMKGPIAIGTPLILSHKLNNTVQCSLKHLITIGKMDQYKGSTPPVRLKRVYLGCNRSQGTDIRGNSQVLSFPQVNCYLSQNAKDNFFTTYTPQFTQSIFAVDFAAPILCLA